MDITNNQLLRFTTAGSVDDGKSTLIGRLLYDSKSIFEDQLEQIETTSRKKGHAGVDLALFTDGLRDEREQGITIDVAYRYFTTPRRKFIIADTPGHIQYTRNMITGASTAHAAIILVDVRHGVIEQTRRHAFIASLLRIPHLIVCVNKMDLVNFSEKTFRDIVEEFEGLRARLQVQDITYIPISALLGDNVVNASEDTPWYGGKPLLETLESLPVTENVIQQATRLPVQTVLRPQSEEFRDYRGYAGKLAGGTLRKGDSVQILPSGLESRVTSIHLFDQELEEAHDPMSIAITLEDDIDISRGDLIVKTEDSPSGKQEFEATLCWLHQQPARIRAKYLIQHTTREEFAMITEVQARVDVNTLEEAPGETVGMNDIARVRIKTSKPLFADSYASNRNTGSFILIDPNTHQTVAAGMIT